MTVSPTMISGSPIKSPVAARPDRPTYSDSNQQQDMRPNDA